MAELAKAGTFCPNPVCPDYEQVQESGNNITVCVPRVVSVKQRRRLQLRSSGN